MPAALDVNREEVRMLVVSVGCREAARQMGLDENTVLQWSARYGWLKGLREKPALPLSMRQPVIGVISPANAQRNVLVEKLLQTRENHLDVALAVSERLKQLPASAHLDKDGAQVLLATGKHAALVGGWNADSRPDSPGKAFGSREQALVLDAELVEDNAETEVSRDVEDY